MADLDQTPRAYAELAVKVGLNLIEGFSLTNRRIG